MQYVVIPLFLMVASAFSIFFIGDELAPIDLLGRLTVLMTLLLTVAAFQLQVVADMPFKEQTTLIDHYFLMAYFVFFVLIWESCVVKQHEEYTSIVDYIVGVSLAVLWAILSLKFVLKWCTYMLGRSGTITESSYIGWHWFLCCGLCSVWNSLTMCLYTLCDCLCACCTEKKHNRRVVAWLQKELDESQRWNQGINKEHGMTAELVLGANWIPEFHKDAKGIKKYFKEGTRTGERDKNLKPLLRVRD